MFVKTKSIISEYVSGKTDVNSLRRPFRDAEMDKTTIMTREERGIMVRDERAGDLTI
jgi:hypothetical protein